MCRIKFNFILIALLLFMTPVTAQETVTEVPVEETAEIEMVEEEYIDDGLISVNFQNVDVNQIIKVIGDLTGTVIIPDESLTGEITVVSHERVEPEVMANILESALMVKGYTLIKSGKALKVVPLKETKQSNVEVKVGASPETINEEDTVITQVMPLQYSSSLKLKTILTPLIGKHGNLIANERTNTLIITDLASNIKRIATIISEMEQPLPPEFQVKTFALNFGDAEKIAGILNDLSQEDKEVPYPIGTNRKENDLLEIYGEIQAYFEEETNTVVVSSSPINFPAIEQIIKDLDEFPPQAMIEVIIMDVTLDDDFTAGIEFSDATTPTLTTRGFLTDTAGNDFNEGILHSLLGLATDAGTAGFTYRILNEKQTVQMLAFILQTQENSKVISTPKIMASNNQESSITVGQEIPIIESSTTDLVNNVTNVDFHYEDVGLILKVTPRISRDNYVNMRVHAELTDLSAQTIQNASVINKREADASVIIPDGHTIVLGGLMRDNNSVIEKKVPILGDIPGVGFFFKKTETALTKTELLIFLTPTVIKDTLDLRRLATNDKAKSRSVSDAQTSAELKDAVREMVDYDGYPKRTAQYIGKKLQELKPKKKVILPKEEPQAKKK